MITKNYRKILSAFGAIFDGYRYAKDLGLIDFAGNVSSQTSKAVTPSAFFFTNQTTNGFATMKRVTSSWRSPETGIILGSGTTPATENDYCLENALIDQNIPVSTQVTCVITVDSVTSTITVTNNNNTTISIGEIGVWTTIDNNGGTLAGRCLLERTVLDAPVVIPAGSIGVIDYTISANV